MPIPIEAPTPEDANETTRPDEILQPNRTIDDAIGDAKPETSPPETSLPHLMATDAVTRVVVNLIVDGAYLYAACESTGRSPPVDKKELLSPFSTPEREFVPRKVRLVDGDPADHLALVSDKHDMESFRRRHSWHHLLKRSGVTVELVPFKRSHGGWHQSGGDVLIASHFLLFALSSLEEDAGVAVAILTGDGDFAPGLRLAAQHRDPRTR